MASFTLTSDRFPEGTSVGAYPRSNWLTSQLPASGAAQGSATATATVTNGVATFTGLADDTRYYAGASVSGTWRYIGFRTDPTSVSAGSASRPSNRVVLLGDSITDNCNNVATAGNAGAGGFGARSRRSWFDWINQALGQRITQVGNAGISGQRIDQIVARIGTDGKITGTGTNSSAVVANAADYDWVFLQGGINDVQQIDGVAVDSLGQVITLATIQGHFQRAIDRLTKAGKRVVLFTTLTSGNGGTQLGSNGRLQILHQLQRWQSAYGRDTPGVVVVEWHQAFADPATGYSLTGLTGDGTHPNALGASRLAAFVAPRLASYFPEALHLPQSNADTDAISLNATMTGTRASGGTNGTGITGAPAGIASNVTIETGGTSPAVTVSKVARTDYAPGEWQQCAVTAGLTKVKFVDNTLAAMGLAVGDTVELLAEFQTDATGWTNAPDFRLFLQALDSGFASIKNVESYEFSIHIFNSATEQFVRQDSGVMKTTPMVIPAGAARLTAWMYFDTLPAGMPQAAGTFRLGRNWLRKVSAA